MRLPQGAVVSCGRLKCGLAKAEEVEEHFPARGDCLDPNTCTHDASSAPEVQSSQAMERRSAGACRGPGQQVDCGSADGQAPTPCPNPCGRRSLKFAVSGSGGPAVFCAVHRPSRDQLRTFNVRSSCSVPGCERRRTSGPPGKPLEVCVTHGRARGFVDQMSRRCDRTGCPRRGIFRAVGTGVDGPRYCRGHAGVRAVCVMPRPKCNVPGCGRIALLVKETGGRPLQCHFHGRQSGLQLRKTNQCRESGCFRRATHGLERHGPRTHCRRHSTMIRWEGCQLQCTEPGCRGRAAFNFAGHPARVCGQHVRSGMLSRPRRKCTAEDCGAWATHGPNARALLRCGEHRQEGDVDLVARPCASCGLTAILAEGSHRCEDCDEHHRHPMARQRRSEMELAQALAQASIDFVQNRAVAGGACALRDRPDFTIGFPFGHVLVECDEHQHSGYPCRIDCACRTANARPRCDCSQARMIDIAWALGTPCLWVRFNPDAFRDTQGRPGRVSTSARQMALLQLLRRVQASGRAAFPGYCSVVYMYYTGLSAQETRVLVPFESAAGSAT